MQKQLLKHNLHSQSLHIKRELKLKKKGATGKNLKWHLLKTALQIFLWPLEKSSGFYVLIDISPRAWRITIRGLWCFQAKRFWPLWNSQVEIKTLQNTFEEVLDSGTNYFCCNQDTLCNNQKSVEFLQQNPSSYHQYILLMAWGFRHQLNYENLTFSPSDLFIWIHIPMWKVHGIVNNSVCEGFLGGFKEKKQEMLSSSSPISEVLLD